MQKELLRAQANRVFIERTMSVNNLFEVAFIRRGGRGAPAVSASPQRVALRCNAECERSEFSSVVSMELKSVVWTDFQNSEEA